jgi:hypothetical protein
MFLNKHEPGPFIDASNIYLLVGIHSLKQTFIMKNALIAASICAALAFTQTGFAQAAQEGKAAKKEMKAEKKVAKAKELKSNAATHKGLEVKGISDPKTRMAKAEKKMDKAEKKEIKADSKEIKAIAKAKKKKAAGVN